MTPQLYIENALKQFNVTDQAISELKNRYFDLTINGVEDKEGYEIVSAARKDIKSRRVDVDKKRKELNEDALAHQKAVNGEAKRITSLLEEIENKLSLEEKIYTEEQEKIKKEKQALKELKIQKRTQELYKFNVVFNGVHFIDTYRQGHYIRLNKIELDNLNDSDFSVLLHEAELVFEEENRIKAEIQIEKDKKEKESKIESERLDKEIKIESDRLEKIRIEQMLESERLEALRKESLKEAIALEVEKEKIKSEKQLKINEELSEKNRLIIINDIKSILIHFDEKSINAKMATSQIRRLFN